MGAAVVSAFTWNVITWYFGLPSSSSHTLVCSTVGVANYTRTTMAVANYSGWSGTQGAVPLWVILLAATAMGLGTAVGGWRIVRTIGQRVSSSAPLMGSPPRQRPRPP